VRLGRDVFLGPYACIGTDVTISDRAQVHAHAVVEDDVRIGPECVLHPHATVRRGCALGARVVVQSGAVIGADGFGYAQDENRRHVLIPQTGGVVIEDDVEIGANTTVDRAVFGATRIGRGTKLDNLVHVAHNVQIGEDAAIAAAVFIAGSVRIGNRVLIGGLVGVRDHVEIGDDVIVQGDSGIARSVEAGQMVGGHPAVFHVLQRRIEAATKRLPEMIRQLRDLERRARRPEGG
jgi:UDP-3-O-[3-hydroxymyristoyl] glucosamine N-acyltransferase